MNVLKDSWNRMYYCHSTVFGDGFSGNVKQRRLDGFERAHPGGRAPVQLKEKKHSDLFQKNGPGGLGRSRYKTPGPAKPG